MQKAAPQPVAVTPAVATHATFTDQAHALVTGGPAAWWPLMASITHVVVSLAIGVGMLVVTFWVAGWASRVAKGALGRVHGGSTDSILMGFVGSLVRYGIVIIGVIAVLQQVGVKTTSILAVLGAASLAIGLALQGGLSNVAAGVMLLFLRPYRIGDRVKVAGVVGKVKGLDLFITRLHDLDNSVVIIPNAKALGDVIVNYSAEPYRRIVMDFGIDYDDNVDLALALLKETAKADPRIVAEPAPWAKVTELGDSSVTVTLRAWTSPNGFRDTRFDLIKQVLEVFQREGLTFAYPHQVAVETRPWTPPDREGQARALDKRSAAVRHDKDEDDAKQATADAAKGSTSEMD